MIRSILVGLILAALSACAAPTPEVSRASADLTPLYPNETPELRDRINYWADHYQVPRSLVQRVVIRESTHRPEARNGPYYGLMQILPATARGMGYQGSAKGLLVADTNLQYAVKYLRGAWLVSNGTEPDAVKWYAKGYYYQAKKKGLLDEVGLD